PQERRAIYCRLTARAATHRGRGSYSLALERSRARGTQKSPRSPPSRTLAQWLATAARAPKQPTPPPSWPLGGPHQTFSSLRAPSTPVQSQFRLEPAASEATIRTRVFFLVSRLQETIW